MLETLPTAEGGEVTALTPDLGTQDGEVQSANGQAHQSQGQSETPSETQVQTPAPTEVRLSISILPRNLTPCFYRRLRKPPRVAFNNRPKLLWKRRSELSPTRDLNI